MMKTVKTALLVLVALCVAMSISVFADGTGEMTGEASASLLSNYTWNPDTKDGSLLSEMSLTEYLQSQLLLLNTSIDVSAYNIPYTQEGINLLNECFGDAIKTSLYLYNVSFQYGYSYTSKKITKVAPRYTVTDKAQLAQTNALIDAQVEDILSYVDDSMTDVEKLLVVHDRLLLKGCYDYTYSKYSAKDFLVDGEAVCQGQTSAYFCIIKKLGFSCGLVSSEEMNHIWNSVYVDGAWYHADLTWDGPNADSPKTPHTYFLKSDEWMLGEGQHYDFELLNDTNSKFDGYFWNDVTSRIIPVGGVWYYVDGVSAEGSINAYNSVTGENSEIYGYDCLWWSRQNENSYYYTSTMSSFEYYDGRLFFNTNNSIKSLKLDGTDLKTHLTLENENEYAIYGCFAKNGKLTFYVSKRSTPNSGFEYSEMDFPEHDNNYAFISDVYEQDGKVYIGIMNETDTACSMIIVDKTADIFSCSDVVTVDAGFNSSLQANIPSGSFEIIVLDEKLRPVTDKYVSE